MSDPLGLIPDAKPIDQNSLDPLGLISKPAPDPINPSFRAAPAEEKGVLPALGRFASDTWDTLFSDKKMDRAKAANAIGISESTGLPASVVYENMDTITQEMGLRDQPPFRDFAEKMMMAPVTYGLLAHPLATILGVGAFGVLSEAENYAVAKFSGKPYQFGAGKGLSEMLPGDSSQAVKDLFWLADMAGKAVLAGGLTVGAKAAGNQFAAKFMRDTTEAYNLPRNVYISPEKIREFHGMGREDVITPEEAGLLKDLNLTRQDYVSAIREGIDIEIPVEKIVTIQDKPWVKGVKDFFRISPYFEENVVPAGGPKGSRPVSGLLEGEGRREFGDILADIGSIFGDVKGPKGERGSFSMEESSSPQAKAARERLKKDYEILKREASDRGRVLAEYLIENGVTPEAATFMINTFGEPDKPAETVNQLLDMAAQTDRATFGQDLPENPEYDAIRQKAAELAYGKVQKRVDIEKRRQEGLIRKQAVIDAREHPVFQAMDEIISAGGLNEGALSKEYGAETIAELRKRRVGLVTKEGGYGADDAAANLMGGAFESGDDLVNAILDWKGLKEEAKGLERWDYLLSEQEEGDFYLDVLTEEAKILRKLLKGNAPKPATGLKRFIRGETGQIPVEELMVSEYDALKAGMKKAEQASRVAFREGRIEGALAEKERQIGIAQKLKARLEAKREALDMKDGILAVSKDKKVPPEYRDQIEALLSDYDLLPRSEGTRRRLESTREFIEKQEAAGEDVTIPKSLMDKLDRYGRLHWRDMTLDQLRDVYDQATMLAHLGKLKNALLAARKKQDFTKTVQGITDAIYKNWPAKDALGNIETMLMTPSGMERIGNLKEGYLAELTKPEFIFRKLDKWEEQGPVWDALYQPIKAASDAEITAMIPVVEKLEAIFKPLSKGRGRSWADEKFKIPGVPQIMTKEKMIMVALNTGNEGNLTALRQGMNWRDEQVQAITDRLTAEEWALVRGVWDLYKEQFPSLAKVYRELTGAVLRPVEGNYHPLVFDRTLSWTADKNAAEAEMRDFFQTIYTKPKPASGFTIERKGGKLPPKLSFDVIFKHLADVNHYTSHALAIRDVQKIISDPMVRLAIERSEGAGPEDYRQLMPWLQEIAKPRQDPLSITEGILKTLRRNTTAVALGLKFSVAGFQWLGAFNSIEEVGIVPFSKAFAEFYTDRQAMVDQIKAMSPEMTARASSWDRELMDAYGRLGLEKFRGQQWIKDSFFGLITLMDLSVSYPTWLAGYNNGMKQFNGDKAKAIEHADFMVRKAQGNAMVKDLAGIQRGSELKKFVTMFYTFFSAMQNQIGEINSKFGAGEKNIGELVKGWWWVIVAPALLGYMMKERSVPSPKQAVKEIISMRLGGYPVIRDMFNPALSGFDYTFSPAAKAGEVVSRAIKEASEIPGGEADYGKLLQYAFESSGYFTGLPTAQAVITIKGFNDLKNGETSDLTRLLMRAPREEEE